MAGIFIEIWRSMTDVFAFIVTAKISHFNLATMSDGRQKLLVGRHITVDFFF